jgi:hypothetical protein
MYRREPDGCLGSQGFLAMIALPGALATSRLVGARHSLDQPDALLVTIFVHWRWNALDAFQGCSR